MSDSSGSLWCPGAHASTRGGREDKQRKMSESGGAVEKNYMGKDRGEPEEGSYDFKTGGQRGFQ